MRKSEIKSSEIKESEQKKPELSSSRKLRTNHGLVNDDSISEWVNVFKKACEN